MELVDVSLMDSWADEEFGAADLGDIRRTRRLIRLAHELGQRPTASLPDATQDPALLKAAYRFFDTDAITPTAILASHISATYDRCSRVAIVLAVQDTSELDWSQHPATTGLGPIHTKKHRGLLMHTMLGITPQAVPVGILQQHVWARDDDTFGDLPNTRTRPIEDKESYRWLRGLEAVNAARAAAPQTRFIMVADAEADIYELLVADRHAGVDLLIRAGQNRCVDHPDAHRLWDAMPHGTRVGTRTIHIPPRAAQPGRTAEVTSYYQAVCLQPPRNHRDTTLEPVTVWAVWTVEEQPPSGMDAVEWVLLTTIPVHTPKRALTIVDWYCCRWGIELWHKTLKSGCKIESRQLETGDRLRRCLAVYSVIAWRILYATMLARAVPDAPCTALLDEAEWQALFVRMKRTTTFPRTPPTLRDAVRWIAQLGGFQGRKGDKEPGITVMWKGFQHLADLTSMYRLLRPPTPSKNVGND